MSLDDLPDAAVLSSARDAGRTRVPLSVVRARIERVHGEHEICAV